MNANNELQNYPLPGHVRTALNSSDRLAVTMHRHGIPVPDDIELRGNEYHAADAIVRLVSRGRSSMTDVTWYGRRVVCVSAQRRAA